MMTGLLIILCSSGSVVESGNGKMFRGMRCGYNWQGGAAQLVLLWSWAACHGLCLALPHCSAAEREYIGGLGGCCGL